MQSKHHTRERLPRVSANKFLYKITPQKFYQYEKNNISFSKPRLVAYYDHNHGEVSCGKRINYLRVPSANEYPLNLNGDLEKFVKLETRIYSININVLLKYEMSCASEIDSLENAEKTKVVARRATLMHIMELCYDKRMCDKANILVSRYNNNLFMVLTGEDEPKLEMEVVRTHHSKFQNILFTDSPNGMSKIDEPIDQNIMLNCVQRINTPKYELVYSGGLQGIIDKKIVTDFDDLDSLMNRRFVFSKQMWRSLKDDNIRLLKIWLESYLANVGEVYIGYKNQDGRVCEPIEHRYTQDLPKNCFWKPNICKGFLHDFLENVENVMSSVNCPNTVFEFQYNFESQTFMYEVFNGKTDKSFIPEFYINFCTKNKSK